MPKHLRPEAEDGEDDGEDDESEEEWEDEWEDYVIYSMDEDATIRNYPDLEPNWPRSWLSTTRGLEVSAVMTETEVNSFFEGRAVQLIVLPDENCVRGCLPCKRKAAREGETLHSSCTSALVDMC